MNQNLKIAFFGSSLVLNKMLIEPAIQNKKLRFVVAGPLYPSHINWPDNVVRIEPMPPGQHREFYAS